MLRVRLSSSPYLATAFVAVHLIAAASLLPLELAAAPKILVAVLITASMGDSVWRRALLRTSRSIVVLDFIDGEKTRLAMRDGSTCEAFVLNTTYVAPWLTVINLRVIGGRRARHVLVVRDNIDDEDFRKLRIVLRWGRRGDTDAGQAL